MKNVTILNGDCIKVMRNNIEDNSIDLVLTSPPYNVGIEYDEYNDNIPIKEYWEWTSEWMKECHRALKQDGRMAIVHYISMGNSRYKFSPK